MKETHAPYRLSETLRTLEGRAEGETITLGKLIRILGPASFGPALLLMAVISILPIIGALPGVSVGTAAIATLLAFQMLFGQTAPWLPARLSRIEIPQAALHSALTTAKPWVERMERVLVPRYTFLLEPPFLWIEALIATLLALGMLVGALVPGGIVPAAVGMIVLALGLTMRDGLLIAISIVVTIATLASIAWVIVR